MLTKHYARAKKASRMTTFATLTTLRRTHEYSHLRSHFAAEVDPRDTLDSPRGTGITRKDGSRPPALRH